MNKEHKRIWILDLVIELNKKLKKKYRKIMIKRNKKKLLLKILNSHKSWNRKRK